MNRHGFGRLAFAVGLTLIAAGIAPGMVLAKPTSGPLYRWSHAYNHCFGNLYDPRAAITKSANGGRLYRPELFVQHASVEIRNRDSDAGYALSAVRIAGEPRSYLVVTDNNQGGDVIAGYLTQPPKWIAGASNPAALHTRNMLRLGDPAAKIVRLLGRPHITAGCGLERWAYRSAASGTTQFGFLLQNGRISDFYEIGGS